MAVISYQSNGTTMILNGIVIGDFINGDTIDISPTNPETARTYGSGNSVNVQQRSDKDVYIVKFRVMKNSDTDIELNKMITQEVPEVLNGSVKESYTKDGSPFVETFEITNGSFTDKPSIGKNNQEGKASMEYTLECFGKRVV